MAILVKLFTNKTDVIVFSTNKILTQFLDAWNFKVMSLKIYLWITESLKCKDIERHAKPFWGYIECILFRTFEKWNFKQIVMVVVPHFPL